MKDGLDLGRRPAVLAAAALGIGAALGGGVVEPRVGAFWALGLVVVAAWIGVRRTWVWVAIGCLVFLRGVAAEDLVAQDFVSVRDLDEGQRLALEPRVLRFGARDGIWQLSGGSGLAREGELVMLLPGTAPRLRAEGLVDGKWARDGIAGRRRVAADCLVRLEAAPGNAWWGFGIEGLRRRIGDVVRRVEAASEGKIPAGLLSALLIGERSDLEYATKDLFTRTGTRHLLAVSGLHVGLLAAILFLPGARLLAWLLGSRRLELALFLVGLLVFAGLVGGSPPVMRAAVVLGLGVSAGHMGRFGRRVDPLNLWGAALVVEIAFVTRPLSDLSLQLSYLATLGLILGFGPLARSLQSTSRGLIAHVPGAEAWRPTWARSPITAPLFAAARTVPMSLAASLAAVLATLPIAWSTFGEVSPIGILLTPLALPLVAWLLAAGWPLALISTALASAGLPAAAEATTTYTAHLLAPASNWLGALFTWADGLPGTPIALPMRPALLLWLPLATTAATLLLAPKFQGSRRRRIHAWLRATTATALAAILVPWSPAPPHPELILLDAGHGTACLLRLETGATWLFDAGTRDRTGLWHEAIAPQLAAWDSAAPHVVLSHGDFDHWSALPNLIQRRPPATWSGHQIDEAIPTWDIESGTTNLTTGTTRLSMLRGGPFPGNEGSRALLIETPGRTALITGDAEAEGLAAMLKNTRLPALDLLLLPHHGSDSPFFHDLIAATTPNLVWLSQSGTAQLEPELSRLKLKTRSTASSGPLYWPSTQSKPQNFKSSAASKPNLTHRLTSKPR